jgi:hypothetical protein
MKYRSCNFRARMIHVQSLEALASELYIQSIAVRRMYKEGEIKI